MDTELKEQIIAVIELGLELADPKRFTMANRIDTEHVLGKVKKLDLPVVRGCFYIHKPTGIRGVLLKRYIPTGKPETILIDTFDNDIYFAPANEFRKVNNP